MTTTTSPSRRPSAFTLSFATNRAYTPPPPKLTPQAAAAAAAAAAANSVRPAPNAPFYPQADTTTFRDLLLFEERLKMNAEMLRRRRRRYSVFLWTFVCALVLMSYRFMIRPPTNIVLLRGLEAAIAVVFITLVLFFASGMYEEKIRYAHSYINHSNKALRPLNMYFNLRRPKPSYLSLIPFSFLHSSPHPPINRKIGHSSTNPSSTFPSSSSSRRPSSNSGSTIMAQIPPALNPRGELIFSSRVDPNFEEGYKRYRAAFERRREEKTRQDRAKNKKNWLLWLGFKKKEIDTGKAGGTILSGEKNGSIAGTPTTSRRATPDFTMNSQDRRPSSSPGIVKAG